MSPRQALAEAVGTVLRKEKNLSKADPRQRVLSGMRPTGRLHLGHLHGVLRNWVTLQHQHHCFFFVADWHALTTKYGDAALFRENVLEMVIDWLAVGVDPDSAVLFAQSRVPEHAELHLLLSMITPLSWLERVPSYKDQQEKLRQKNLDTYGFLGYPLLQAADILSYRAALVPVGADQVAHVELTREVARRFNHVYGREPGLEEQAEASLGRLDHKAARQYRQLRTAYQQQGEQQALEQARKLLEQQPLAPDERLRLLAYLEGSGRKILVEPGFLLTATARLPGLDGQKMSKSYDNTIGLREDPEQVSRKIRTMATDPARVRRTDPGDPRKCPVWQLHLTYSDKPTRDWVAAGCKSAGIGCVECKKPVIEAVIRELEPIQRRAQQYQQNRDLVRSVLLQGSERAREYASQTLAQVRAVVGISDW